MKKETDPNILVEKQTFYIAEFEQEAAWLSFMNREGWKFLSTDGIHYRFERTEKEDWSYQLDWKGNGVAEEDYLQMYQDFGWEYVGQFHHWFYFRKKRVEGEETDTSAFSDRESKIELCKRILNGQLLRLIPIFLLYGSYISLFFINDLSSIGGFLGGLLNGLAIAGIVVFIFLLGNYLGQMNRIRKMMKELGETK
ncbi:MAG: DUF2812 domain-containing protein [Lachnospiraceae bacterium]|nr:DUF2812 domain-containing protein [Lachnospiraceae bacterium]